MKRIQNVLTLFLMLAMLTCLFVISASAEFKLEFTLPLMEQSTDVSGDGWGWSAAAKTLTLDGVNIESDTDGAIVVPDGTTIVLTEGTINTIAVNNENPDTMGILCLGSLIIKGNGVLDVTGGHFALFANHTITIDSSTINAHGNNYGLYANEKLIIDGAELSADGSEYGIDIHNGMIEMVDSKIVANGGEKGVFANIGILIRNCEITANGGKDGIASHKKSNQWEAHGEIRIEDSVVVAEGGDVGINSEGIVQITKSQVRAAAINMDSYSVGVFSGSSVMVNESDVFASGGTHAFSAGNEINVTNAKIQNGAKVVKHSNFVGSIELSPEIVFEDGKGNILKEITITAEQNNPFTDITSEDYYYDAVLWALDKGVTTGLTDTTFGPDATCTRAQAVTFLWRAMGSPEPASIANPFTDVAASDYFYKPVLWAVEQGITNGTSATTFSPNDTVTRGHTITFLYRAMGKPVAEGNMSFGDVPADEYYYDPVLWASNNGVASTSGSKFYPTYDCPRAQIVYFIYNALN